MRVATVILILGLVLAAAATAKEPPPFRGAAGEFIPAAEPRPAPTVTFEDGSGKTLGLDAFRGKLVVLNFWATWCVPCIQEHAALSAAARSNPDVTFLGVVYEDTTENALNFLAQRGSAYNSYADEDGKTAIAFGVYGVPETFFVNAAGTIVDKYVGPLDDDTIFAKLAAVRK